MEVRVCTICKGVPHVSEGGGRKVDIHFRSTINESCVF